MESYFIVSFPGTPNPSDTVQKVRSALSGIDVAYPLKFPNLRVGTLDNLLNIADSVSKTDQDIQQVTFRIEKQLAEFQRGDEIMRVGSKSLPDFFTTFEWDNSKYKEETMTLGEIAQSISQEVAKYDSNLKDQTAEYQATRNSLQALQRRASGTLAVKNLADIIHEDDFFESVKLTTIYVVVPKGQVKEWTKSYAKLAANVVPRSSRLVAEDDQSILYSVVLFKTSVEEFKTNAREARYQVREYTPSEEETAPLEEQIQTLNDQIVAHLNRYIDMCVSFHTEVMKCWMHIKYLRVFAESVLHFGLPINFQAFAIMPQKKNSKRILDTLSREFSTVIATPLTAKLAPEPSSSDRKEEDEQYYSFVYLPAPLLSRMVA